MRSRWNLPIYAVFAALCVFCLGYILAQKGVPLPGQQPFTVSATFADGAGILPNNDVYMNGTRIGHVATVSPAGGHALVSMVIDHAAALPLDTDATAQVRQKNLLGETYVELTRGHDGTALRSGGAIPLDQTVKITQIDQVLAIFDPQTQQRLQLLINGAGDSLANRGGDLNSETASLSSVLSSLDGPAEVLSSRQQQLEAIVLELQRLFDTLSSQRAQVRQAFGTFNDVMGQLAGQESQIGGTLQQADSLLTAVDGLVAGEAPALEAVLSSLPTDLSKAGGFLTQANTTLGALVPARQDITDIFPHLGSSFADTDPSTGQHVWSVFAVSDCTVSACPAGASGSGGATGTVAADGSGGAVWSALAGAGG